MHSLILWPIYMCSVIGSKSKKFLWIQYRIELAHQNYWWFFKQDCTQLQLPFMQCINFSNRYNWNCYLFPWWCWARRSIQTSCMLVALKMCPWIRILHSFKMATEFSRKCSTSHELNNLYWINDVLWMLNTNLVAGWMNDNYLLWWLFR